MPAGIYIIHAYHGHEEDFDDVPWSEMTADAVVHHYVVYNAGRRILYLYPEVLLLEDDDFAGSITDEMSGIRRFLSRLERKPYQIRLNNNKGSYERKVRRLFFRTHNPHLQQLPLVSET